MPYINGKKVIGLYHYASGTGIAGVTYANNTISIDADQSPTSNIDINSQLQYTITASSDTQTQATIEFVGDGNFLLQESATGIDDRTFTATNLTPDNIKKDITILGVTGTYNNGVVGVTEAYDQETELQAVYVSNTSSELSNYRPIYISGNSTALVNISGSVDDCINVLDDNYVSVCDGANVNISIYSGSVTATNLTPENIKSGTSILGVTGSAPTYISVASEGELPASANEGDIAVIQ